MNSLLDYFAALLQWSVVNPTNSLEYPALIVVVGFGLCLYGHKILGTIIGKLGYWWFGLIVAANLPRAISRDDKIITAIQWPPSSLSIFMIIIWVIIGLFSVAWLYGAVESVRGAWNTND